MATEISNRQTVVVHGRLAMREIRLEAARNRRHGLQVMTFEQLAARLAGGLSRPVDDEALRFAIQQCLPVTDLGELDRIKTLPGMVDATADTLRKAWRAGIDLQGRAGEHPRLLSIANLERAVVAALPPTMLRPADLVASAMRRLDHAPALFGPINIVGITELSPCWRPLLTAVAARIPVQWTAGPRAIPAWLDRSIMKVEQSRPETPAISSVSAATAYHEAVEAVRWARRLISSGQVDPAEIAISSVTPAGYDDHFLALRADANLDIHFVHGVKVTACREGQAAAALADILVRGLSQTRMRRLAALLANDPGLLKPLPAGWTRILPSDAPLTTPEAWNRLVDRLTASNWPDAADHGPELRAIIALLAQGASAAEGIGEKMLSGRSLSIWRKALLAGASSSLDMTLELLRQDDALEPCTSIAWMPANALAASPRRYVRLLGLNSSRWPRGISEDRILSDHIIPTVDLDPLSVGAADRRDFETVLATSSSEVVLSRARRDVDGRLLGRSTLLHGQPTEIYLRRNAIPPHAFSETDRLTARPEEFQVTPQAISAMECWRDWHRQGVTTHDGLVRADHPVMLAILNRTQSASSLRQLLRNPLGFVWQYGLRLRAPKSGAEPLVLDALEMGQLAHMALDLALRFLEARGGLSNAQKESISTAAESAVADVARIWETERPVPPHVIWQRTLDDVRALAVRALTLGSEPLPNARAFGEVPFGGAEPKTDASLPWDAATAVEIPDAGFSIAGYIDRLDISEDRRVARVCDYKTGRPPKGSITLDGGKELQRCLYAFAVKALLGKDTSISASLHYLREGVVLKLEDPEKTLADVAGYLLAARANLRAGNGVIGRDSGGTYDDLDFALPANAGAAYCKRKSVAAIALLGPAAQVWEAP